jgi:replication fork clamp-binding protein CrfC
MIMLMDDHLNQIERFLKSQRVSTERNRLLEYITDARKGYALLPIQAQAKNTDVPPRKR